MGVITCNMMCENNNVSQWKMPFAFQYIPETYVVITGVEMYSQPFLEMVRHQLPSVIIDR